MKNLIPLCATLLFSIIILNTSIKAQSVILGSESLPTGNAKDTLLFYNEDLGAFRFGNVQGSQNWNLTNIGRNSFAAGKNTRAVSLNSVALGDNSIASGITAISLGRNTQSTANYTFSTGLGSIASGPSAFAAGQNTTASQLGSAAFGNDSDATGNYAFTAGNMSLAEGAASVAMGSQAIANKTAAISLGIQTQATGLYSFAAGRNTHAKARTSFAFGRFNEGLGSESAWDPNDPILEVGIGADANNKTNALTILKNGNHGIGTSAPTELLDVRGGTRVERSSSSSNPHVELHDTNDGYGRLKFSRPTATTDNYWTLAARPSEGDTASRFNVFYSGDSLTGNLFAVSGLGRAGVNVNTPSDGFHVNAKEGDNGLRIQLNGQTRLRVLENGGTTIGSNNVNGTPERGLYVSGNVGFGISNPDEKLEINGGIVVGDTEGTKEGAIRYHEGDFEGYNGVEWVSLTKQKSTWGEVPESLTVVERGMGADPTSPFDHSFGEEIDISLDYAVVSHKNGAPQLNSFQGQAYIYKANGSDWDQVQVISSNDGENSDQFATSVDISGDYLIAGAPNHDLTNNLQGAAYIFKKNGNTWEQDQKLFDPAGVGASNFGTAVAIKGIHAVVSSTDGILGDLNLHVYKLTGGNWALQQILHPTHSNLPSKFDIDLSGDGEFIICGMPSEDNGSLDGAGSAFVFQFSGGTWSQIQELAANPPEAFGAFGNDVVIDGTTLAISAKDDMEQNIEKAGAVYIFELDGPDFAFRHKLVSPDIRERGNFGNRIDMADGLLVIAQPGPCQDLSDVFRMSYLYQNVGSHWSLINKLRPAVYDASTLGFGSVAMDENRIIIGSTHKNLICVSQSTKPLFFYSQE